MGVKPITINKFNWGLNLSTISEIWDNQFQVASNVFYNSKWQLQTRYGIEYFGNAVWSNKPITSYFFYQRDDTLATMALCNSWTAMYKYNEWTGNRSIVSSVTLTEFETLTWRTTWRTRRDYAVYKNVVYMGNWVDYYASYDGTTYTTYSGQPKYRYVNMVTDRLFWCGVDANPSTLYYTAAAPTNGNAIDASSVVVWGDELWRINGMEVYWNIILALKSSKIYSIDVTAARADAIDSQTGWFSDRTIQNVGNSLVYLTERWIDTLKPRYGVAWASALESKILDEPVSELTWLIPAQQRNANCALYIKKINNYIFSFDTTDDNIPDTTLVYNAQVKAWTQYTYPSLYSYGKYIDSTWEEKYVCSSATEDRMYEIETWFTDLWSDITYEIKSKAFDFWEPWSFKTFDQVEITWLKSKYKDIELNIEVDWINVWGWMITDDMIVQTKPRETLWVRPIGVDTLTWSQSTWIDLYEFIARVPLYVTGSRISFGMKSTGWSWILSKASIGVNKEAIDVFWYMNIV